MPPEKEDLEILHESGDWCTVLIFVEGKWVKVIEGFWRDDDVKPVYAALEKWRTK